MSQTSAARQFGLLIAIVMPSVAAILGLFLALMIWLNPRGEPQRVTMEELFNLMVVAVFATLFFLIMHRACYRQMWTADRAMARGETPDYNIHATQDPPHIAWPMIVKLRHAIMKLAAIAGLLLTFGHYSHQVSMLVVYDWLPFSVVDSAGFIFMLGPVCLLLVVFGLAQYPQRSRRDRGQLDSEQRLLLQAEGHWLYAYAMALGGSAFMCAMFGFMIIETLG